MDIDVIATKVRQFDGWKKDVEDFIAQLRGKGTLIGKPAQGIIDENTESDPNAVPQGFFGSSGPSLPVVHDLEGLNEQIQSAGGVFDLSKIDIGSFKAGFANLVHRLKALEQGLADEKAERERLANATADAIEAIQAHLTQPSKPAETAVDAQGNPTEPPGT